MVLWDRVELMCTTFRGGVVLPRLLLQSTVSECKRERESVGRSE